MHSIAISWQFIITIENGNAVFLHFPDEPLPVFNKNPGINRNLSHYILVD
jgi:hypothetical protein